jgi:hypothetical protein
MPKRFPSCAYFQKDQDYNLEEYFSAGIYVYILRRTVQKSKQIISKLIIWPRGRRRKLNPAIEINLAAGVL